MNKRHYLVVISFFILGFMIYYPGIQAPRYGDDFVPVPQGSLSEDLTKTWTSVYQRQMFYRPVEDTLTILCIYVFGWNTLPWHMFYILLHCSIVAFLYFVLQKLKFSRNTALFAAFFMLAAQVNVMLVGSNDTLRTLLSSAFCLLSLWLVYNGITMDDGKPKLSRGKFAAAMLLFLLSLLSKESSVAFLPLMFILLFVRNYQLSKVYSTALKRTLLYILPFIGVFVVFFLIRSQIVPHKPSFGTGRYDFNIGLNIVKNLGTMLFGMLLPISSVRTFLALQGKDYRILIPVVVLVFSFAALITYGIWKSKRVRESLVLICFMIAGFFPNILLNHVNEQYTYFSMPFLSILVGIGLDHYAGNFKGLKKTLIIGFVIVYFILNALSVMEKTSRQDVCGNRANYLFGEVNSYFNSIEHNGTLVLVNTPAKGPVYSVFLLPDFEPLRYTELYIHKLAGRDDFKLAVIEWNEIDQWKSKPGVLMLKLDGNKVVRME